MIASLLALAMLSATTAPAPELDAYRALANGPGARRLLALTRAAMERELTGGEVAMVEGPDWPGPPRPVYVTLASASGTRACVGSDEPLGPTLTETLRQLAVRALTSDRRRAPVRAEELANLRVSIAFAGEPTLVADPMTARPALEGLRVDGPGGSVAFLPGEARTVAWALREARRIGVLTGTASDARYSRFPVVVMREPAKSARPPREEKADAVD